AGLADAGAVGLAIRLRRGELEARALLLPLVLEVLLVDPVAVLRPLRGGAMVADRREQERERGEPLLAVDDQVPVHARRPVRGRGSEDDGAAEVGRLSVLLTVLRE